MIVDGALSKYSDWQLNLAIYNSQIHAEQRHERRAEKRQYSKALPGGSVRTKAFFTASHCDPKGLAINEIAIKRSARSIHAVSVNPVFKTIVVKEEMSGVQSGPFSSIILATRPNGKPQQCHLLKDTVGSRWSS